MKKVLAAVAGTALAAFAGNAWAVKPLPPVSVKCQTVSSQHHIFKADCAVSVADDAPVRDVRLSTMQDGGTFVASFKAPPRGVGKWEIVFEMREKKPCTVLFDAFMENGAVFRASAIYDPYGILAQKAKESVTGAVKEKKGGGKVKEYPSN